MSRAVWGACRFVFLYPYPPSLFPARRMACGRLTNRLKGTAFVSETNILRQRKDNLKAANERHLDMQR